MNAGPNRVVSIDYTIQLANGQLVESSQAEGRLTYLHGRSQLLVGVERAIDGRAEGEAFAFELSPSEGYGERDPDGVFLVPREAFPDSEEVETGMTFSAERSDGHRVVFRVLRASGDMVLIDTNHPLAGKTLHVWVAVQSVRDATSNEQLTGRVLPEDHQPRYLS